MLQFHAIVTQIVVVNCEVSNQNVGILFLVYILVQITTDTLETSMPEICFTMVVQGTHRYCIY